MNAEKLLLWCLPALFCAGCYSYGPRFDPRHDPGTQAGTEAPYFTSLAVSNHLQPDWLSAPTNFYRLGPGDGIEIEMLGDPASRAAVTVGPDGKIYYSLLPGTFVWGMTLSEAKTVIEDSLARYIRVKPEIGLTLANAVSRRVWLLGHVRRPGAYPLATPMTVLEAISAAGGTIVAPGSAEELADLDNSFVMRDGKKLGVNLRKLLRQGDLSQNIYLQPDDFVYLRSAKLKEVSVLGAVARPNVVDYTEQTTVLSALASVGGTIPYAYVSHVVLVRGALAEPRVAVVDYNAIRHGKAPDVLLQPGDIVYVPFRPFQKLEVFANVILEEFVRTVAINEGVHAVSETAAPVGVSVPIFTP